MPSYRNCYFCGMWAICKKEFSQYFSNLTGYLAIIVFLVLNGLLLFVFSSYNILAYGYASLDNFFTLAPYILLFLIPAVTMRLLPDEYRSGTIETLRTRPLNGWQIIGGKYLAATMVVWIALLPTITYVLTIIALSEAGTSLDKGALIGSYVGLLLLAASFTAVGICCSAFTRNAVVAFLLAAFACLVLYAGFGAVAALPAFRSGADYYIEMPGMEVHYRSLAKGVIDSVDIVYFLSVIALLLWIAVEQFEKKN